jgi:hypothetical protein
MEFEKRMKSAIRYFVFLWLVMPAAIAQNKAAVSGHFTEDSLSIGQVIPYSLAVRYPYSQQVLFPDSTFSFAPFELNDKLFFTTKTKDGISYDSVVYLLTTFEIDSIQRLQLPVFVLQGKDCVAVYSGPDSIFLQYRVASVPDSVSTEKLPLKTNTLYQNVKWIFNYPVLMIIVAAIIGFGIVIWVIFGKRIRKYFTLRRLHKDYEEFMARFNRVTDKLGSEFSVRKAEEALVVWKSYMEDLEKSPYTKFTSREILRIAADPSLDQALRSIDRGIYGGIASTLEPFKLLQSYSLQRFKKKEEEVKHG